MSIISKLLIILLLTLQLFGQEFGLSLGATFHQYRTQVAQYPPTLGITFKSVSKFDLTGNSKWKLMPEFGYFMSNSKAFLDSSQYLSVLSGQNVPYGAHVTIWTHFIDFRLLIKYHFETAEGFGIYIGPNILTLLGQTLIASYEIPNGPDGEPYKIQEWQNNPLKQVTNVIPRFIPNLLLGTEFRMLPKSKHKWFLYANIILQADKFGLPSGGEFGIKSYFAANK